jgi:hypothetical protein
MHADYFDETESQSIGEKQILVLSILLLIWFWENTRYKIVNKFQVSIDDLVFKMVLDSVPLLFKLFECLSILMLLYSILLKVNYIFYVRVISFLLENRENGFKYFDSVVHD